jgi:hypothetical protein
LIAAILEHVNRLLECLRHIVTIGVDPSFGGFALLRGMEETAAIAEAVSVTKKSLTLTGLLQLAAFSFRTIKY